MKTIVVTLEIEVPDEFNRKDERLLDQVFADTLYEEGYHLLDSKEYKHIPGHICDKCGEEVKGDIFWFNDKLGYCRECYTSFTHEEIERLHVLYD